MNPDSFSVLVRPTDSDEYEDKTRNVVRAEYEPDGNHVWITFASKPDHPYRYPSWRVRIVIDDGNTPGTKPVLDYWRAIVSRLPDDDPLRRSFGSLKVVDRESALAFYLHRRPIASEPLTGPVIFPFGINLSQRDAVRRALENSVSVIDGPPGTGKTQTIMNVIANLVRTPNTTVGVVSLNNAAVNNVGEKLAEYGYEFLIADVGKREKRDAFFRTIPNLRNKRAVHAVQHRHTSEVDPASDKKLVRLDDRLIKLQELDLTRAERSHLLSAYLLEQRHFKDHLERHEIPPLEKFPLLWKSSGRILSLLVDSALVPLTRTRIQRIALWFRQCLSQGVVRSIDPEDTDVVLRLQEAYYERKIAELEREIDRIDKKLRSAKFRDLVTRLTAASLATFGADVAARPLPTPGKPPTRPRLTRDLVQEFPVILSTCHSLRASIPEGMLLDYLIIDEASQVDLPTAALAMALARRIVVVGDLHQLQHIAKKGLTTGLSAPSSDTDYDGQNILSSVIERYGDHLPRTMLREHYRCDPMIIEYCNRKFYGGQLIPFTTDNPDPTVRPMRVHRTPEGGHMRVHVGGGTSNQREIDSIREEVLQLHLTHTGADEVAVVAPYRLQADKAATDLRPTADADTVHKYQGRQRKSVVLSTVVDDTREGNKKIRFVDDPHLVNVAVSRAEKEFVLMTHHSLLPRSRNLRDLIEYIEYRDPSNVTVSSVISIFDLLYRDYSARLQPLAKRLVDHSRFPSENIAWTVLETILAEMKYRDLEFKDQVVMLNMIGDLDVLLDEEQETYVRNRASVDFVIHNRVTNRPLLAIEVDGFKYHEDNPTQLRRDNLKNAIFDRLGIDLLRLPTTGHSEEEAIRAALDTAMSRA